MVIAGLASLLLAVTVDTEWYAKGPVQFKHLPREAVVTPWNNLVYNFDSKNLAEHGLHPFHQHLLINLPQLIGPAFPLLLFSPRRGTLLYSAICGIGILSCFRHQEARFLLPAVPLLLSSIKLPQQISKAWMTAWVIFNLCLGILMGVFHQGGVVPAQLWIGNQHDITQAFWWKTYSPPKYLLGHNGDQIVPRDMMGMQGDSMVEQLTNTVECGKESTTLLVAPLSATYLDQYKANSSGTPNTKPIALEEVWRYSMYLNLDDMDFGDDGVLPTLSRIIGRRGLGVWKVRKQC